MKLSELKTGEKASIVKVKGYGAFRKRLVEMGFIKGKIVESILNAPLKDPIKYKVMGYEVSIRRSEAELIEIVSEKELIVKDSAPLSTKAVVEERTVREAALNKRKEISIALVGNPNSGKTSLFNYASGGNERVGNYGGVTIDSKEGHFQFNGYKITLVDLPGTYSLSAYSPEERYVQKYILEKRPDVIINVIAASNIERNLYLTTQLIDMNLRTVVALNMFDELAKNGDQLDYKKLGEQLRLPFVPTVARKNEGLDQLFSTAIALYEGSDILDKEGILIPAAQEDKLLDSYHHHSKLQHKHAHKAHPSDLVANGILQANYQYINIDYGREIEKSIKSLEKILNVEPLLSTILPPRCWAIKLLEKESDTIDFVKQAANSEIIFAESEKEIKRLEEVLNEDIQSYITDARYAFIDSLLHENFVEAPQEKKNKGTAIVDAIVTNKYLAYPIFLLFMFVMFQTTFILGEYPKGWIEDGAAALGDKLAELMSPGPLRDLLSDGIINGVGGVLSFLPHILILYFFISLMEDTGYMARAAFILDKIMQKIGLHGKSFIPLIMGFGCNVPAIMATRTIENRDSRMITILINPFMSCTARLPVYVLIAGAFFPENAGLVLFGIYLTGIMLAVILSLFFRKTFFKKDDTPFVMEQPPYRLPTALSIFKHSWERGKQYLQKMGTIILLASVLIWFLGYYPRPDKEELTYEEQQEQQANSYIGKMGHFIEPIMRPLGFDWKISIAIISGAAAKEIVVSTLGVLYTGDPDEDSESLAERLKADLRPDGTPVFTPAVALSLLIFVLIYFPCVATIAAIKNETGSWRWALFTAVYTIVLAWLCSFAVYQILS